MPEVELAIPRLPAAAPMIVHAMRIFMGTMATSPATRLSSSSDAILITTATVPERTKMMAYCAGRLRLEKSIRRSLPRWIPLVRYRANFSHLA